MKLTPVSPALRALRTIACACLLAALPRGDAAAVGSVSTVAVRPLGMGGAFMAIDDQTAAAAWNPAAFTPAECRERGGLRFHLNLLGAPAVARETGLLAGEETDQYRELTGPEKVGVAFGGVVKSASFRRGGFACGLLLLEEYLEPAGLRESKGLADASDLLQAYYSTLCVVFQMGPRVSMGLAETLYAGLDESGERRFGSGRSYGALLRPNDQVDVGLVYLDIPSEFGDYRREIEGLAPRTMNAGLAYRPVESLTLTIDLRDLAEKHADTALEPRAGAEWSLWGQAAIRAGHYREESDSVNVLSLGFGAIPMSGCRTGSTERRGDSFVLNYASLLSEGRGPRHLLSAVLHF